MFPRGWTIWRSESRILNHSDLQDVWQGGDVTGKRETWQPTTLRRFVKAFPTSACAILVETDAGQGYLKALGGPEGPHTLVCEWVGTQLAKWFGLSTFDFALITVTEEDELPFHNGELAQPGPAFITRAESGDQWSGEARQLRRLANPEDVSRLVVFDTWTLNCDRHSEQPAGKVGRNRVNLGNVFLSEEASTGQLMLKAMDHTHCFTCGRELTTRDLRHIDRIRDERVFGLFPGFRKHLDRRQVELAASELRQLPRGLVVGFVQTVPTEWDVTKEVQDALVELILRRASFVADTIVSRLWPQRQLAFGDEQETETPS